MFATARRRFSQRSTCLREPLSENVSIAIAITSSSWLNLVERWFAEITRKRIRRGSFTSVADLIQAIQFYIDHNNTNPKPFVWTKRVDQILEKVARCKGASVTEN